MLQNKLNDIKIDIEKNFPLAQQLEPIWLAYEFKQKSDGTFTKPPLSRLGHTVKDDEPGVTFAKACEDGYPGIKINKHTTLIAFDVDDKDAKLGKHEFSLDELPSDLKKFIADMDTYMEYSPSGCGLRIFFHCLDKSDLPGRTNLLKEKCIGGELFMNSGYVTVTGDKIAGEKIKEISAYQLRPWFERTDDRRKAEVIDIPTNFKEQHPDISLVKEALGYCKLDQCDRVKEAYKSIMGQDYNHYDYWLKILTACHYYAEATGQMNEVTQMIMNWSQTDELSFESDEDVITHWSSFSNLEGRANKKNEGREASVTYSTLMKFAKLLRFQWPVEKYTAKGELTGKPVPTDIVNLQALIEYHGLKFYWDIFNRSLYITGEKTIINKYFMTTDIKIHFGMYGPFEEDTLNATIVNFAQLNGYSGVAASSLLLLWKMYISGKIIKINSFKLWLETSEEKLPEDMIEKNTDKSKSNLDYLLSCITYKDSQNQDLARMYFDTFFYEVVMPIYNTQNKYAQRSFMIILSGPEACRKTTFCAMLFPANLRRQFITTSTEVLGSGKSDRDFKAQLVESVIVIIDEAGLFLNNKNDSMAKNLITTDVIDYAEIYAKHTVKYNRNAAIIATTNKTSFSFEVDSNRRLAIIGVIWIDTNAMEKINWHYFYRHYVTLGKKAMMNGVFPWKLTNEVIQLQYQENEKYRAHTDLEIIFRETFDFNIMIDYEMNGNPQTNPDLYGINQVKGVLKQRHPETHLKPSALKNELKRICGKYTNTIGKRKGLKKYEGYIEDGIIHAGQWTKYVLPPLIDTFE